MPPDAQVGMKVRYWDHGDPRYARIAHVIDSNTGEVAIGYLDGAGNACQSSSVAYDPTPTPGTSNNVWSPWEEP